MARMDLVIDTEELELMLDGEPMCEANHEAAGDIDARLLPCSIVAVAVLDDCAHSPVLVCRMVVEELEREPVYCTEHHQLHYSIRSL